MFKRFIFYILVLLPIYNFDPLWTLFTNKKNKTIVYQELIPENFIAAALESPLAPEIEDKKDEKIEPLIGAQEAKEIEKKPEEVKEEQPLAAAPTIEDKNEEKVEPLIGVQEEKQVEINTCPMPAGQPICEECERPFDILLEAKVGFFLPENKKFREIYGCYGAIYGLEASFQTWRDLYTWVSASYFPKSGHSLGLHHHTHIYFVPLGLGFKYLYNICRWDIYGGAGALGTYLHLHDKGPGFIKISRNWMAGGIIKAGAIYHLKRNFFFDLFTDYSFMRINFHKKHHKVIYRHPANIGGWSVGLGFGYDFCP